MKSNAELSAQISDIISSVLECHISADDIISMKTCGEWTSVKHIELILSLEEQFQICFKAEDIPKLTSKALLVSKIESMLHA